MGWSYYYSVTRMKWNTAITITVILREGCVHKCLVLIPLQTIVKMLTVKMVSITKVILDASNFHSLPTSAGTSLLIMLMSLTSGQPFTGHSPMKPERLSCRVRWWPEPVTTLKLSTCIKKSWFKRTLILHKSRRPSSWPVYFWIQ